MRVSEDRVAPIDALVADGAHPSRASVIIEAIDRLVAQLESERIDREIVEGYERIPQTAEELDWADWTAPEELAAGKNSETRPDRCAQAESYSQVVLRRSNLRAPARAMHHVCEALALAAGCR